MRYPGRIPKVLVELGEIWKKYPDLRLMQLLLNCDFTYWTEDDVVIKGLKTVYGKRK